LTIDASLAAPGALLAILGMAAATYVMRTSGFWAMGHLPLTPRLRKILEALPGAVVVATILPIALRGGPAAWAGLAAAALTMATVRNEFLAIAAGVGVAALARAAGV
jgi:uncharacterized membrane protein